MVEKLKLWDARCASCRLAFADLRVAGEAQGDSGSAALASGKGHVTAVLVNDLLHDRKAKARAVLEGRSYCNTDDVRAVARPVLRHRVLTNFSAESMGISSDTVINQLLEHLPERSDGDQMAPEVAKAFSS